MEVQEMAKRQSRKGLNKNEIRVNAKRYPFASVIVYLVKALRGTRTIKIKGGSTTDRKLVAEFVKPILRSAWGEQLNGLMINLVPNYGGHAYGFRHQINVGIGRKWGRDLRAKENGTPELLDRTRKVLLHEMAHIIRDAYCPGGCARGGACTHTHDFEFHVIAFKMYAKFLNAEDATDARLQEWDYHPRQAVQAAKAVRKYHEFKEVRRQERMEAANA